MKRSVNLTLNTIILALIGMRCGSGANFSGGSVKRKEVPQKFQELDALVSLPVRDSQELPSTSEPSRLVRTFPLESRVFQNLTYTLGGEAVRESLVIDNSFTNEERIAQQITRPLLTQFFKQGNPGIFTSESFNQKNLGILDLLIVVDNSRSMEQEQLNLSKRLGALLLKINDSDWRMNVVTTDPKDGCSRAILKKGDPDLAKKFELAVTPGVEGNGFEEGIRMAVEGLSCQTADWVRPNSSVAVLFVSDEDNCSQNGVDCKGSGYEQPEALIEFFEKKMARIPGKTSRVYGIFWEPGTACEGAFNEAIQYSTLVKRTGGQWGSICDSDYSATLNRISADVNDLLISELELKNRPVASTVRVKVDGVERNDGYKVIDNKIVFETVPTYGSRIEVSYFHSPSPILTKFPIAEVPAIETIQVVIENRVVDPATYTYDETERSLVFNDPPTENAEIKFQARKKEELKREFILGKIPMALISSTLNIDGRDTGKYQIIDQDGDLLLKLEQAPRDGEKITLNLKLRGDVKKIYSLAFLGSPGFTVAEVIDVLTGMSIPYKIQSKMIEFDGDNIYAGQRMMISYLTAISKNGVLEIATPEMLESLQLGLEVTGVCSLEKDFDRLQAHLACQLPAGAQIPLMLVSVLPVNRTVNLSLTSDELRGMSEEQFLSLSKFAVFVDGVQTTEFTRSGQTITLQSPSLNARELKIEVQMSP